MSSHNSNNSDSGKKEGSYQYASTAPSVSNILNLAQVQNKPKQPTGLVVGLKAPAKPVALGLGPTVNKPLQGSLKLTSKPKLTESTAAVIKESRPKTEEVPIKKEDLKMEAEEKKKTNADVVLKAAKVEKPKRPEKHSSKYHSQHQQNLHVTESLFDPSHWRLFVGNLGPEVNEPLLFTFFQSTYPSASKALIVRDLKSQKSKGYGFVAFADGKEFLRALKEMNGKWLGNRQCIIKKSDHQPKFL